MEIDIIYPKPEDEKEFTDQLRRIKRENTLNTLIGLLTLLSIIFIFLLFLPILITIIGYTILIIGTVVLYKIYLERHVLNFIQKYNLRRK